MSDRDFGRFETSGRNGADVLVLSRIMLIRAAASALSRGPLLTSLLLSDLAM
jgi:hypothetical protein